MKLLLPSTGVLIVGACVLAFASAGNADSRPEPFTFAAGMEAGGNVPTSVTPTGSTVHFLEGGTFSVVLRIRNASDKTVTVTGARTPEPVGSLVTQIGTRIAPFTPCKNDRVLCIALPTGRYAARLRPVTLAPGGQAGVQFLYKLGTCADAATSTLATGTVAEISYRDSQGPVQSQTLPLKAGRLRLLGPAGVDCVPRPYSHIGLVGSFTTKPGHKPVVGSDGDTCFTSRNGDFVYTSRYFSDRTGIRFRVKIILSRLAGKGLYTAAANPAARGRAHIIVTGGFGDPGSNTFVGQPGAVTVTQAASPLYSGKFHAVLSGHRRFFRAYGTWRCTTKVR